MSPTYIEAQTLFGDVHHLSQPWLHDAISNRDGSKAPNRMWNMAIDALLWMAYEAE